MEGIPGEIQSVDSIRSAQKLINGYSNLILFVFQLLIILIVVGMSIYNLTIQKGDTNMWTALLSSSIGYILPNPKLKFIDDKK